MKRHLLIYVLTCLFLATVRLTNTYSGNILPNSSFEITTLEDMPDCWGQYEGPKNEPDWFRLWKIDRKDAYHGQNSIVLEGTGSVNKVRLMPQYSVKTARVFGWPMLVPGKIYTLSLYMKSDGKNFPVEVNFFGKEKVIVGENWQRYTFRRTITKKDISEFYVLPLGIGKLWIDALQLEPGPVCTDYKPAEFDQQLFKTIAVDSRNEVYEWSQKIAGYRPSFVRLKTDLSLYTNEKSALGIIDFPGLKTAESNLDSVTVKTRVNGNWDVSSEFTLKLSSLNDPVTFPIPLQELGLGTHSVEIRVVDNNTGKNIAAAETPLRRVAHRDNVVKIDHTRRVFIIDNKPFFFFGAAFLRPMNIKDRWTQILKEFSEHGYTVVIANFVDSRSDTRSTAQDVRAFFDAAHKYNLKVIPWIESTALRTPTGGFQQARKSMDPASLLLRYQKEFEQLVGITKDHPALLAWYLFDEVYEEKLIEFEFSRKIIEFARLLDPYHPAYVNYGDLAKEMKKYGGKVPGDMICMTQYPIPLQAVTAVARNTLLELFAAESKKPVALWLQLWGGYGRYPTPDEFRVMVYLAAIYGATCFKTWPSVPCSEKLWRNVKSVISEINRLFPVLMSQDADVEINADSEMIHFSSKRCEEKYFIIAVNVNSRTEKVKFTITSRKPKSIRLKEVRNLFEEKRLLWNGNCFYDAIPGYGVKVYVLNVTPL